mmetsp:Transcript_106493/g.159306  ORF Transcript_106493/g.159306 Transcript_106493/m.159306 type:complete len:167 (+) Transcript_106493:2-502(+)
MAEVNMGCATNEVFPAESCENELIAMLQRIQISEENEFFNGVEFTREMAAQVTPSIFTFHYALFSPFQLDCIRIVVWRVSQTNLHTPMECRMDGKWGSEMSISLCLRENGVMNYSFSLTLNVAHFDPQNLPVLQICIENGGQRTMQFIRTRALFEEVRTWPRMPQI